MLAPMSTCVVSARQATQAAAGLPMFPAQRQASPHGFGRSRAVTCCSSSSSSPTLALASFSTVRRSQQQQQQHQSSLLLRSEFRGQTLGVSTAVSNDGCDKRALGAVALLEISGPAAAKWCLQMVSFYVLMRLGIAKDGGGLEKAQAHLSKVIFGDSEVRREKEAKKAAAKWKETTKGTLVRRLRVPSNSEGRKILRSISSVLSDDDLFRDATSHKGCQIRRETAHSETVCCNNVRAIFDELPTPHIEVEITVFPAGPLTTMEYQKAERLESVLRKGHSI